MNLSEQSENFRVSSPKVSQLDLIQAEVTRITGSRDAAVAEKEKLEHQAVRYQNELQRVT